MASLLPTATDVTMMLHEQMQSSICRVSNLGFINDQKTQVRGLQSERWRQNHNFIQARWGHHLKVSPGSSLHVTAEHSVSGM